MEIRRVTPCLWAERPDAHTRRAHRGLLQQCSFTYVFSDHMCEAFAMAVEEELLEQRRALAAARGLALRHLPREPIEMIGKLSGLTLEKAESINENIDRERRSKERRNL